ncbi:hypothetical protein BDE36_3960 [Arcticibacter tournemirensis]|uniref:DUF4177 domain-containing protein n=1 Tax=Arcticibacter tournemirensis TaxID=699437 RepID=A0A5M9HH74_9SPHI|nr:hypothetical protein [Arcticibacter tournemirensis]KAA8486342.1 hypothetical protein F1649_01815 [Arcticibacter tournemirensis]TQM52158.1 hypothetical protein BDE36_3960 [Arcticibacter tournemirensis]
MKNLYLTLSLIALSLSSFAQQAVPQFKVVTIVESIVPGGLGRSRLIETKTEVNAADFTTERTDGKDSKQGDVKRGDAKIDSFAETKLLNFFSVAGINFQNIASNDAIITSKMNELAKDGWKLSFVTSGVESDGGKEDGAGIFITRLIFSK